MGRCHPAMILVGVLSLTLVAGCAEERPSDALASAPKLTAELDLQIGSIDDPDYSLTFIRAIEASVEGRIYSLHPVEQVIRVFHADGTFAGTIGGRGDGPSEFQNVIDMGWVADTLWALDASDYRFKQFSVDGDYLGSFAVPFRIEEDLGSPQPPRARGLLFDGTVHGSPPSLSRQIAAGTLTREVLLLMTRDGEVTDTVTSVPLGGNEWAISDPDDPRRPQSYSSQPFADGQLWAFSPTEGAVILLERPAPAAGPSAAFRVTKLSLDGDTVFSREHQVRAVRVIKEEVDSILDTRAESLGDHPFFNVTVARARELAEASLYRPAFKPPITTMVLGRDGSIWLRQQPVADREVPWLILNSEGEAIGQVLLPVRTVLHVIDPPHIWGSTTDELDVPYLVRYQVH